jgi:hypothetical protein
MLGMFFEMSIFYLLQDSRMTTYIHVYAYTYIHIWLMVENKTSLKPPMSGFFLVPWYPSHKNEAI